jgi:hypothetical protein
MKKVIECSTLMQSTIHAYEVPPRKDNCGVDLISDVLPFGRLWYEQTDDAIGYAMHFSRSADAVIRVYDAASNVIRTHEHKGDFKAVLGLTFFPLGYLLHALKDGR